MGTKYKSTNKYTKEYCQEILNNKNSGLTVIEIKGNDFRTMECVMSCGNEGHDYFVKNCYTIERTNPYCKQCKFEKDIFEKYPNGEFIVKGKFINRRTKIDVLHTTCNRIWSVYPNNILRENGSGCGECYKDFENISLRSKKKHSEFIKEISDKLVGYDILDIYQHGNSLMHVLHKECGRITPFKPNEVRKSKRKTLCKWCSKEKQADYFRKTHEEYISELELNFPNQFEVLSKYISFSEKIRVKHLVCNIEYDISAGNLLRFGSCEHCKTSLGEKIIHRILTNNNIQFEAQKKFHGLLGVNGGSLSYDFYIKDCNILIEYSGEQHYKPVEIFGGLEKYEIQKENDRIKEEYAIKNNFNFIIIPYWEFKNIEQILRQELKIA